MTTRRIAVGQFHHETNVFATQRTGLSEFERTGYRRGAPDFRHFLGTKTYVGGILHELLGGEHAGQTTVVPLAFAECTPSGLIRRDAYETIRGDMLEALRRAWPVDAVVLSLHGSAMVDGYEDPEGDLLSALRELLGPQVPLVATLDLHANLSERMVAAADALFGVHHYPHIDQFERGIEAAYFAHRMLDGAIHPVMAFKSLPMHTPARSQLTAVEPARHFLERAQSWEKVEGVIDCTVFYGYRYADSPLVGTSVLAITEGDEVLARNICDSLAEELWQARERFRWSFLSPEESVAEALRQETGPIVIAETSDNPGGGAAGDATSLLGAILAADAGIDEVTRKRLANGKPTWACFGMMLDREVVAEAHAAGVGSTIRTRLGAKTDGLHGEPLTITGRIRCLTDGRFQLTTPMGRGSLVDVGRTVALVIGGVDVVVVEERQQVFDAEVFRLHGIEPARYHLIGLKSSLHFYAGFGDMAKEILIAAGDGVTTPDFSRLPYKRLRRPFWPIDR